jgi:hypothetical protein
MSWYGSSSEDEELPKYTRRFCPKLNTEHERTRRSFASDEKKGSRNVQDGGRSLQFVPIPIPLLDTDSELSSDEFDDDEDEDEEEEDNVVMKGKLDEWDRGARSWLSSGTVFFLLILFHLLQVRSDIRKFTSAANNQLHQACNVLEHKTVSLSSALNLATQDVGPISFKFVRDLKGMIRKAFHFAGQIFGGRIREAMIGLIKKYYCLFVGAVVVFRSLSSLLVESVQVFSKINRSREDLSIEEARRQINEERIQRQQQQQKQQQQTETETETAEEGENYSSQVNVSEEETNQFIQDILHQIQNVIDQIAKFLVQPEQFFAQLFVSIFESNVEGLAAAVSIPNVAVTQFATICGNVRAVDFDEIEGILKRYMVVLVAVVAVLLILFNAIQFLITFDSATRNKQNQNKTNTQNQNNSELEPPSEPVAFQFIKILPFKCARNASRWLLHFFSYRPFWVFLGMGIFGFLHLQFSNSLHDKASDIMNHVIFPAITALKDKFTVGLANYLELVEQEWSIQFKTFIEPITSLITQLSKIFSGAIGMIVKVSNAILKVVDKAVEIIKWFGSEVLTEVIVTILDCLLLKNFRIWKRIVDLVQNKLIKNNSLTNFNGGVLGLLRKSIDSIFAHLNVTKYLKELFSFQFLAFLNLICKRSIFLYIYLILAFILICQGLLMVSIKFLLGYF